LSSSFRLRNTLQRFLTQFSFQLYSPLLSSIQSFSFKRNSYRKSKLTFLDKQKIYYNKF
jgi:ribosomal protein L19